EERVVTLDRHHGLPRLDSVTVMKCMDRQLVPVVRAELEDRDRLVHPAEPSALLLKDLHHDARSAVVLQERRAGVVEVRVGVVTLAHLLDRKIEDLRWEPIASALLDGQLLFPFELEARGERSLCNLDLLR